MAAKLDRRTYKVWYQHNKYAAFETFEAAQQFASELFKKTGCIVGITW